MKLLQATQQIIDFVLISPYGLDSGLLYRLSLLISRNYASCKPNDVISKKILDIQPTSDIFDEWLMVHTQKILHEVNFSQTSLDEVLQAVDLLLQGTLDRRGEYEYITPKPINKLIARLANVQAGETVYAPALGLGGTLLAVHQFAGNKANKIHYIGQEINKDLHDFAHLYLTLNGLENCNVLLGNSLNSLNQLVDVCIGDIPFFSPSYLSLDTNISYIELITKCLKPNGRAVIHLVESYFTNKKYSTILKKYLENNWIERIIRIRPDYWNRKTFIPPNILVLNLAKTNQNIIFEQQIKTDDFEAFKSVQSVVPISDVIENGHKLSVNYYIHEHLSEFNNLLSQYPQNQIVQIKDLVTIINKSKDIPPAQRYNKKLPNNIPYIQNSDLLISEKDFYLNITKINKYVISPNQISESVFLLSAISKHHKLTYFKYDNQPIAIGSNIIAFKMKDENIDIEYIISQFYSRIFEIQWEQLTSGTTISKISLADFLEIKIILPAIEEQHRAVFEFRKQLGLEAKLIEAKREAKNTEYDVIRITIHDLNQKLGAMQNDLSVLKTFLEEKVQYHTQISWEDTVVPIFADDTPEEIAQHKLGNVLNRIISTRNEAAAQLAATREELQNNTVNAINTNIKHLFEREIAPLYHLNGFVFRVQIAEDSPNIMAEIDPNRIKNMIRNLVENAQKHGKATEVYFFLSYWENKESIRIFYQNNGKPFPNDFNFERDFKGLYQKTSSSKGTGIGGYSINKTIELHNGSIRLLPIEKGSTFPVQMEIILPTTYTKNIYYDKSNPYFVD